MNKRLYYVMMGLIMLIILNIASNAFLSFYPYKTLVVKSATVDHSILAGDTLNYVVDYCKYTDKPASVFRTLHSVDETQVIPFPAVNTISVKGCNKTTVPLQTFANIVPGQYYLLVDVDFKMNPAREIHVIFKTNNFKIK